VGRGGLSVASPRKTIIVMATTKKTFGKRKSTNKDAQLDLTEFSIRLKELFKLLPQKRTSLRELFAESLKIIAALIKRSYATEVNHLKRIKALERKLRHSDRIVAEQAHEILTLKRAKKKDM
jgi:hypothetical protein